MSEKKLTTILNHRRFSSLLFLVLFAIMLTLFSTRVVMADPASSTITCADGSTTTAQKQGEIMSTDDFVRACGARGYDGPGTGSAYAETDKTDLEADCNATSLNKSNCAIIGYIVTFTKALTAAVGIVVTIMIVWGGIKYTASKDNPQETAAAKTIIRNAVIALVFYFFTFALLQWLIPGGIL